MGFHPDLLAEAHWKASQHKTDMAFPMCLSETIREWQLAGKPTLVGDTRPTGINPRGR